MTTKQKVVAILAIVTISVAIGRYTVPEKVRIETKIVEVEKKTTQSDIDKNKHKDTVVTVVKAKDGSEVTTTHITEDTNTDSKVNTVLTDDKTTDKTKEVTRGSSPTTIAALAAVNFTGTPSIAYGLSVQKPVLGPLGVQVQGFTNMTFGAGISLTF